jgi:hypothetical protein
MATLEQAGNHGALKAKGRVNVRLASATENRYGVVVRRCQLHQCLAKP